MRVKGLCHRWPQENPICRFLLVPLYERTWHGLRVALTDVADSPVDICIVSIIRCSALAFIVACPWVWPGIRPPPPTARDILRRIFGRMSPAASADGPYHPLPGREPSRSDHRGWIRGRYSRLRWWVRRAHEMMLAVIVCKILVVAIVGGLETGHRQADVPLGWIWAECGCSLILSSGQR